MEESIAAEITAEARVEADARAGGKATAGAPQQQSHPRAYSIFAAVAKALEDDMRGAATATATTTAAGARRMRLEHLLLGHATDSSSILSLPDWTGRMPNILRGIVLGLGVTHDAWAHARANPIVGTPSIAVSILSAVVRTLAAKLLEMQAVGGLCEPLTLAQRSAIQLLTRAYANYCDKARPRGRRGHTTLPPPADPADAVAVALHRIGDVLSDDEDDGAKGTGAGTPGKGSKGMEDIEGIDADLERQAAEALAALAFEPLQSVQAGVGAAMAGGAVAKGVASAAPASGIKRGARTPATALRAAKRPAHSPARAFPSPARDERAQERTPAVATGTSAVIAQAARASAAIAQAQAAGAAATDA